MAQKLTSSMYIHFLDTWNKVCIQICWLHFIHKASMSWKLNAINELKVERYHSMALVGSDLSLLICINI